MSFMSCTGETFSYASKLGDKSAGRSLALLFMVLREKAIKGDRRAIKTLQDFDAEYNRNAEPLPEGLGFRSTSGPAFSVPNAAADSLRRRQLPPLLEELDKSGPVRKPRTETRSACCVAAKRVTDALQCRLQSSEE